MDILATAVNEDVGALFDNAFVKSDKKPDNYPKVFEISENFSLRPEDFTEVFDTANDSIAHYVYKYSGADFVATSIYNSLSPVKPEDIDLAKKGTDVYSFPESLKYYAGFIPTTKSLIETLRKGEGVSLELIGRIERMLRLLFDTGSKGDVLTKADKLGIANTIVDTCRLQRSSISSRFSCSV